MSNAYFEGWYFKHTNNNESICFISGIIINNNDKHAFIQVITNNKSEYFKYNYSDFSYSKNPFYIRIADNYFSLEKIEINIKDIIKGEVFYSNRIGIKKNIMGPFAHLHNMECNHGILSMYHTTSGSISYKDEIINLYNGIGYIEKDWGISFPKRYIWIQGNNFENINTSLFFSYATIPYKSFKFNGHICVFLLNGKEYRFATYNLSKVKIKRENDFVEITLKKRKFKFENQGKSRKGKRIKSA